MDDDQRWRAVAARDADMEGRFVYAVRTTGVFCRPSCPSRRPQRRNVLFFEVPEAALEAGFRPCKRCRPETAAPSDPRLAVVRETCKAIQRAATAPTLAALGAAVGVSPHHLQRLFTAVMGVSPRRYAEAVRLSRLRVALRDGEPVGQALYGAGYGSSSRLYEAAPGQLGMTPASYAKGGAGAQIAYAIVAMADEDALGCLLVAATGRGICMVALGDDEAFLEAELRAEFPAAELRRDDATLGAWTRAVAERARGRAPHADLPLDVRATAFQWQVWDRLRRIPAGEIRSYGEIAAEIGRPGAARAVGRACASNPVAVLVPCHRAVGGDGGLHGYRWGVSRKRALLEREGGRAGGGWPTRRPAAISPAISPGIREEHGTDGGRCGEGGETVRSAATTGGRRRTRPPYSSC